jgi:translocation and assembly module TamB
VTGAAAGWPAQPATLDLAGRYGSRPDPAGAVRQVRLDRLDGKYGPVPFVLAGPATAELTPGAVRVKSFTLRSNQARIAIDGRFGRDGLGGGATLTAVPLSLAQLADPSLKLQGQLDGTLKLDGSLAAPRGDLDLKLAGAKLAETTAAGLPAIDAGLQARWRGERVAVTGSARSRDRAVDLSWKAALPVRVRAEPLAVEPLTTESLDGSATGRIDLSRFNDLLAATGDRMRGRADLDLKLAGTIEKPRIGGTAALRDGGYQNYASGLVLSALEARVTAEGETIRLQSLTAKTANGGTLAARGAVMLDAAAPKAIDLTLTARNAQVLDMDLGTARIDADITVAGSFADIRVAGPIRIVRAELRVPDKLPPSITKLDVVEINGGPDTPRMASRNSGKPAPGRPASGSKVVPASAPAGGAGSDSGAGSAQQIRLDMTVQAQNQVFVSGRGLNAELGGDLTITGTAAAPRIAGDLTLRQGTLDLLGHQLTFTRGRIQFQGGTSLEPVLDLEAETRTSEITATIKITGRVSAPKIELTSTPPLPQDEVLSYILFAKRSDQLSAFEAIQLAQSAAQLAGIGGGGGMDLLDKIRRTLGIDRLDLTSSNNNGTLGMPGAPAPTGGTGTTSNSSSSGPAVSAGKYVSRNIYVGVQQGAGPDSSRAKVQIDITRNLQLEADVGTKSQVGVQFQMDY